MLQKSIGVYRKKRFLVSKLFVNSMTAYNKMHKNFYGYLNYSCVTMENSLKVYINQFDNNSFDNLKFFNYIKKGLKVHQLLDIIAVDNSKKRAYKNIELVYVLLDVYTSVRYYFVFFFDVLYNINSIMSIYKSANWLEREIYEFFGIIFKGHLDLRRLILDYGFKGNPGRKDFPQSGYIELKYSEVQNVIVNMPIEFVREFNFFSYEKSWKSSKLSYKYKNI